MKRLAPIIAAAALLAACSPQKEAAQKAAAGGPVATRFNTDLPMAEFMGHVVDPAAFMYWKGSGVDVTEKGERDLSPTTDEGWDVLVSGASILVEAGNMMQLPGRVRAPEADWNRYAQMLTDRAMIARAAAEKHDRKAVFDEGGRVFEVCVACHEQFVVQPGLKANGPAKADPLPPLPPLKGK